MLKLSNPMFRSVLLPGCAILALCSSLWASDTDDFPEVTADGLVRVHDARLLVVYADPAADLAPYTRIMLVRPQIAFRKNWEKDRKHGATNSQTIRASDIKRIRENLANEFMAVFESRLQEAGYELTSVAAPDVLIVRPAIVNLDVYAPELARASKVRTLTDSAGEMTLYVELYDSVTEDLIAKAMDPQADTPSAVYGTRDNADINKEAADEIITVWADTLVLALNAAKSPNGQAEAG